MMTIYTNKTGTKFKCVQKISNEHKENNVYTHLRELGYHFSPMQNIAAKERDVSALMQVINDLPLENQISIKNMICEMEDQNSNVNAAISDNTINTIIKFIQMCSPLTGQWDAWKFLKDNKVIYAWIFASPRLPRQVDQVAKVFGSLNQPFVIDENQDDWIKHLNPVLLDFPIYEIINCNSHGQKVDSLYRLIRKHDLYQMDELINNYRNFTLDQYMLKMYEMKPII